MGFLFTHFAFFDSMSLRLVTTLSRGLNLGAHPTAQTEKPLKWFHVHHWDSVNGLKLAVNEKLEVRPTFRLLRQSPAEKRTIFEFRVAAYELTSASLETEFEICSAGGGGGESGRTMPCIASQSSVGIISIASQGQPSRKAPSGPLLVHF